MGGATHQRASGACRITLCSVPVDSLRLQYSQVGGSVRVWLVPARTVSVAVSRTLVSQARLRDE
jgi:hypothetical protein